jgi:hypothetical protein
MKSNDAVEGNDYWWCGLISHIAIYSNACLFKFYWILQQYGYVGTATERPKDFWQG